MGGFHLSYFQVSAVLAVLLITYLLSQLLLKISLILIEQQTLWIRYLRYWIPVVRILVWSFGIYACFYILAPPKEIFFAAATSVGVAVGLASQELIKNLFGSLIVWSDKLYQEGDRILINDVEGVVQSIGMRSTKVRAYNDTLVIIPNSLLLNAVVTNANLGKSSSPVLTDFFLPINTDPQKAMECSRLAALSSDLIEPAKPVTILACDILSGYIPLTRIRVKAYVRNAKYEKIFISDITKRAKKLFKKHNLYGNGGPFAPDEWPKNGAEEGPKNGAEEEWPKNGAEEDEKGME